MDIYFHQNPDGGISYHVSKSAMEDIESTKERLKSFPNMCFNPKYGEVSPGLDIHFCCLSVVTEEREVFITFNAHPSLYLAILEFASDIAKYLGYEQAMVLIDNNDDKRFKAVLDSGFIVSDIKTDHSLNELYTKTF